jgi:hypothetical protein
MNLNEKCLLKFLQSPDELVIQTEILTKILLELANEEHEK